MSTKYLKINKVNKRALCQINIEIPSKQTKGTIITRDPKDKTLI